MREEAVAVLTCPHCGGALRRDGVSLTCGRGHTADIARQGYVSLLGGRSGTHTADSAAMIEARERVLGAGLFEPVVTAVVEAASAPASARVEGAVVDLGSGPGYYLERVLEATPDRIGIALDNSKHAARRAARCHPRAAAVVADIWQGLPLASGSAAIVLNVFAPRNGEEIERILVAGGLLITVTPGRDHLQELREPLSMISVDADKQRRLRQTLGPLAERMTSSELEWRLELSRSEVADLVSMGPNAGRLEPGQMRAALDALDYPVAVTGSVTVSLARKPA